MAKNDFRAMLDAGLQTVGRIGSEAASYARGTAPNILFSALVVSTFQQGAWNRATPDMQNAAGQTTAVIDARNAPVVSPKKAPVAQLTEPQTVVKSAFRPGGPAMV